MKDRGRTESLTREVAIQGLSEQTVWRLDVQNGSNKKSSVDHIEGIGNAPKFHVFDSKLHHAGAELSPTKAVELAELSVLCDEA